MFDWRSSRTLWRTSLLVSLVVVCLGASACGGSKSSLATPGAASGASATGATGADQQQLSAYRTCLQDHGADVGGGFGGQAGSASGATGARQRRSGATGFSGPPANGTPRAAIDPATLQAAQDACKDLQPSGGFSGPAGAGGRGGSGATGAPGQQFAAYLSCLTDNGAVAASGPTGARGLGSIDRAAPAFTTANEKCKVLLPDGVDPFAGGGGGGGRGVRPGDAPTTTTAK